MLIASRDILDRPHSSRRDAGSNERLHGPGRGPGVSKPAMASCRLPLVAQRQVPTYPIQACQALTYPVACPP